MQAEAKIRYWPKTDVGRIRDANEDSCLVDEALGLAIVADGMGGHAAGEVASNVAVHACRDTILRERDLLQRYERGDGVGRQDVLRLMEQAVQNACAAVYGEAQKDPSKRGMGTTIVALLLVGLRGFIAHVGDSRIYLIRRDSVHQLTQDHSLINELLKRGRLTPEQIAKLNMKNAVTRAVGVYESVEVDTLDFDLLAGDRFLLCSDGLTEYAQESDILRVFREQPAELVAQTFIDLANEGGGKDNITAVIVDVPETHGQARLANEVNLKLETLHAMALFRHLSYQELVRVMNLTEVRSYDHGDRIVSEGEERDEMFIVLHGSVRVHTGEAELRVLGPGQHFGEMSLVDRAPRSASVDSEGVSKLMVMRRYDFFDIIRKDHDVAVKLLWSFLGVLSERLRSTSRDLAEAEEQLASRSAEQVHLTDADITEIDEA